MKLSLAKEKLKACGISEYNLEARLLFSHFGGISDAELIANDVELDSSELLRAIDRRCQREPLAYILGYTYFYREKYFVSESCLIPRSDTEILVDYGVKNIPRGEAFLDLCTGSGCVGISVLANTENTVATLVDLSSDALVLARKNAKENGVEKRAEFIEGDVFTLRLDEDRKYFAILSNPPYVTKEAYACLEPEIYKEPKMAFVGGEDGLDYYRSIIPRFEKHLKDGGFFAFEIGFDQEEAICRIARQNGYEPFIKKDFGGNARVCILRKP